MYMLKKAYALAMKIIALKQKVKPLFKALLEKISGDGKRKVRIAISSGHGSLVPGAAEILDEVTEARRVVRKVAARLRRMGAVVAEFHDDTSATRDENISTITGWHNAQGRLIDVSVHFNAFEPTNNPRGTEVLFQEPNSWKFASQISRAISDAGGFRNRGPKQRFNLGFLSRAERPAILIEVCFVDSAEDARLYNEKFDAICEAIASALISQDYP